MFASPVDPRKFIVIRGARQHNLTGFDLDLPKNSIVVVTGPSGSGKSSLAFDTIFAEGQRRYMESLSAYARQFLQRMDKPDVDFINGLAPAIAIEQKSLSKNPRSTVATQTELYDHLRMLYAQIGKTVSPISDQVVSRDSPRSVADTLQQRLADGTRFYLTFPLPNPERGAMALETLKQRGFFRLVSLAGDQISPINLNETAPEDVGGSPKELRVLQDRLMVRKHDLDTTSRIADSVEHAFREGRGRCSAIVPHGADRACMASHLHFSTFFEKDGLTFAAPTPNLFSFNSPIGACPMCKGFGRTKGPDHRLIVPDEGLSLFDGAIKPFRPEKFRHYRLGLLTCASQEGVDVQAPYASLSDQQKHIIWRGKGNYDGILGFFKFLEQNFQRKSFRFYHARFQGLAKCIACFGSRLRPEARYVRVGGQHLGQIVRMTTREASEFFDALKLTPYEKAVAGVLLDEIRKRLHFLVDVGLDYLTLGRTSETLSGGESQRISLATSMGSALVGALYVLDEPTIGLHPRDTQRLVGILQKLRDLGNTVIVVEHDADIMRSADHIVDLGPGAGHLGGNVVFEGPLDTLLRDMASITGAYLSGKKSVPVPKRRRRPNWSKTIKVKGARANNLKRIDVEIPVGLVTCVTGVSGSGKSTLVHDTLYQALRRTISEYSGDHNAAGVTDQVTGQHHIREVIMVDQKPIGRTPRSNPVTYTKAFDSIRALLAKTKQAKMRGYQPGFFSFNIRGGRCEECEGEGLITIEMQFLADLYLPCEACNGTRYSREALNVRYRGKNVHDILSLTVDEAIVFFEDRLRIRRQLKVLSEIGLGYIRLGQPAPTLSGGEAQRIKLGAYMGNFKTRQALYVFDEPTTGLHFDDVRKLIAAVNRLANSGNTVVIVEHNLDFIKCADWIIDLGPEGGRDGGYIVATGTPEDVAKGPKGYTGRFLRPILEAAA